MTIAVTTGGDAEDLEFGIAGVGTSELLTVQLEADVEFDNDDGSVDVGQVIAHVRLRK